MRNLMAIALLLLPLTACNDGLSQMDWRYLPAGGAGGGSVPAPAQAPSYSNGQPLAPGVHKMLEDPEAQTEAWEYDTFANSQGEAESNCERIAEEMTRNGGTLVRSVGARQVSGKLFKCQLVSEVPHGGG